MPKSSKESAAKRAPIATKIGKKHRDAATKSDTIGPELSRKILSLSKGQRAEIEREEREEFQQSSSKSVDLSDEDSDNEDYEEEENDIAEELVVEDGDYVDAKGMTEQEERLVGAFMNNAGFQRRNLADLILEKIREKEEAERVKNNPELAQEDENASQLSPKIVEAYSKIGKLLQHYTAGKLPKLFKIIPSCKNWEELLWLTNPDLWSPHASYAATRIFASNLNPHMAQRFYNIFLLEKCRRDISENKRLNYHLYQCLRKSVYKPAAFFKGILLPLATSGNCTLREATIFGSVIAKTGIPSNHSAVALLKLAELPYTGASSMFIKVLLNKKYALPHRVISALVEHFMGFLGEKRELPVLWHQSLLAFVQRYKGDINAKDRNRLKELLRVQQHRVITEEIRRDLFGAAVKKEQVLLAEKARQMPQSFDDDMEL